MNNDIDEQEFIDIDAADPDAWNEFAERQGWSDGLPLVMPTEAAVQRFVDVCRGDNKPFAPVTPRQVIPTLPSLAANAVMAGCRPEYFPVVIAALRGVQADAFNLHGTLATTHSCAPMIMVNGPVREQLKINCGSNCFGQGTRANASIGRALGLVLLNIGGAKPGEMDRSTMGSAAKFTFCFGENEEASPWAPYHVRCGYDRHDSVVTVMSGEPPHNINDHGSTSGEGVLTTFASTISQPGANTIYARGPYFLIIGPEHAETLKRDGFDIEDIQAEIFERSRVHVSRVSVENQASYAGMHRELVNDHYYLTGGPEDIHIAVVGGPGKHSAFIPSFGGTAVVTGLIAEPGRLNWRWMWQCVTAVHDFHGMPVFADDSRWDDAQATLHALDLGDGLPLAVPTAARIEAMLAGVRNPERVHGLAPPLFGEIRADVIAYQCVLAGCVPGELAVVLSASRACLEPEFNLLGLLTTTGTAAVALVIHGPVAASLNVNSSTNCLGPGTRANACIGRALALTLRNVAGARAGVGDMATMGQPAKYTMCFAENADGIVPCMTAQCGLPDGASAVTVLGISGTAEVLPAGAGACVEEILGPLAMAMGTSIATTGARARAPGAAVVLLPPELARALARRGHGLDDIRAYLYASGRVPEAAGPARIARSADAISVVVTGGPGVKMTHLPLWGGGSEPVTRLLP